MKHVLFALIILSVIVLSGCVSTGSVASNGPRIEVNPPSHSFGEIEKVEVEKTFTVTNTGDEHLTIHKVTTSCGCTTASIGEKELDPGEQTELLVSFDPNKMPEIEEDVYRIVYIKSNDPERPEVEIEVTAKVIGGISG